MIQRSESTESVSWKDLVAQCAIPWVRPFVRYGPLPIRRAIWNHICQRRLARRQHHFTVRTEYGRFTGDSSDHLPQFVYFFGRWEPEISQLITQRLRPGDTFVDVGANVGWYTLLAANKVGRTGRVVAIEASPVTFGRLEENIKNNAGGNVRILNAAAWGSESFLSLFQGPVDHSGISTVVPEFAQRRGCKLAGRVRARPLFALLSPDEVAALRILKIDAEGAEREVLQGLEPLLDDVPENFEIFLELSPTEYNVDDLLRPFRKRGYRAWIIPNNYKVEHYLNFSPNPQGPELEELVGLPEQQVDVLLTRTRP